MTETARLAELEAWAQQVTDALDGRPLPAHPDEAANRIRRLRKIAGAADEAAADSGQRALERLRYRIGLVKAGELDHDLDLPATS